MRIVSATFVGLVFHLLWGGSLLATTNDAGGKRAIGAVLPDRGGRDVDEEVLALVTEAFVSSRSFDVIERARLDKILEEQKLKSFLGDDVQILGKLAGLSHLALVNYTAEHEDDTTKYSLVLRIVDVSTGEVSTTIRSEAGGWKSFMANPIQSIRDNPFKKSGASQAAETLAREIRKEFPIEGYAVRIAGEEVVVDLGTAVGCKKGDVFLVLEQAEAIRHPVTGAMLPGEVRVVAELKVKSASELVSITTVKSGAKRQVVLGDRVRFKAQGINLQM